MGMIKQNARCRAFWGVCVDERRRWLAPSQIGMGRLVIACEMLRRRSISLPKCLDVETFALAGKQKFQCGTFEDSFPNWENRRQRRFCIPSEVTPQGRGSNGRINHVPLNTVFTFPCREEPTTAAVAV